MTTGSFGAFLAALAAFLSAFVLNRQSGLARGFDVYEDDVATERRAGETTDLAEKEPVRLQELLSSWDDYEREVGVIYAEGGLPVGF